MSDKAGAHTVVKTEVNYRWANDGGLTVWIKECDDLSFEDTLRLIKVAVDYWLDEELVRQKPQELWED